MKDHKRDRRLSQKDRVLIRKGPRGKSADVVENPKARTSERTPEGPRSSDLEGPSSKGRESKERPRTSVRRTRVPHRKSPR